MGIQKSSRNGDARYWNGSMLVIFKLGIIRSPPYESKIQEIGFYNLKATKLGEKEARQRYCAVKGTVSHFIKTSANSL